MSVDKFVHCHVCPMKDHCAFSAPKDSFHFHSTHDGAWDLEKLSVATANCKLKKLMEVSV